MSNLFPSELPSPFADISSMSDVATDDSFLVEEALLFPQGYEAGRMAQEAGYQNEVSMAKQKPIAPWMDRLAGAIGRGDAEEYKQLTDYMDALNQYGSGSHPVVQEKYARMDISTIDLLEDGWNYVLAQEVRELTSEAGWGDRIATGTKELFTADNMLDNMELADPEGDWFSWRNWAQHTNKIAQMKKEFLQLPVSERIKKLPEIKERLKDIHDGNVLDMANSLSLFMSSPIAEAEEGVRQSMAFDSMLILDYASAGIGGASRRPFLIRPAVALHDKLVNGAKAKRDFATLQEVGKTLKDQATSGRKDKYLTEEGLAASFHPLTTETIFRESVDGVYATTKANLEHTFENIEGVGEIMFRWLRNEENPELLTRESVGLNDPKEFNARWNQAIDWLDEHFKHLEKNTGVQIEYKVRRATDDGLVVDTRPVGKKEWIRGEMTLKYDVEEGVLGVQEMSAADLVKSPVMSLDQKMIGEAQRIVGDKARVANVLSRQLRELYKPLRFNIGSKKKVDAVLRNGDLTRTTYTIEELKSGVNVKMPDGSTKKVVLDDPSEIEVYFGVTRWNQEMRYANNFVAHERKVLKGMMSVEVDGPANNLLFFVDEKGDGSKKLFSSEKGAQEAVATFLGKKVDELTDAEQAYIVTQKDGFAVNMPANRTSYNLQAKPYRSRDVFLTSLENNKENVSRGITYFDSRTGKFEKLDDAKINSIYEGNAYVFARMESPIHHGGTGVNLALVRNSSINKLHPIQLDFTEGYIPRIAKDAEYGVYKRTGDGKYKRLSRLFATKTEAERFAAKRNEDVGKDLYYETKSLTDLTPQELEDTVVEGFGGAFVGKRTNPPKFGTDGLPPEYYDSYEAMMMNIDFLSNVLPLNAWRLSTEQRWFNTVDTVAEKLNLTRKDWLDSPNHFQSDFRDDALRKGDPRRLALEAHRKYINDILRIPAKSEQRFKVVMQNAAESLERVALGESLRIPGLKAPANLARKSLLSFSHTDPYSLIRTSTFHPMLGAFNWSQLVVQAAGATIAAGMYPGSFLKRAREMMALSTVRFMDHRSPGFAAARDKAASAAGMDAKEFAFLVEAYRKSGLIDSILMNADYNAAIKGYGMTKGAVMRLLDTGTVMYQMGERVTIEYTFLQAFANWRKLNPTAKLTDDAVKQILVEHKRIGMDMGPANKGWYQKGWTSPVFQFQQVFWKYWGNMFGKKWTNAEKAKLLMSQTALFGGAAYTAFTPDALVNGWEQLAGGKGTIDDNVKKTIREGGVGILAQALGLDAEVSYRLSVSGQDNIVTTLFKNGGIRFKDLGPWVAQWERYGNALKKGVDALTSPILYEYPAHEMKAVIEEFFRATSSGSNLLKARALYAAGRWATSSGRPIFTDDRMIGDWLAALAASGGFQPDKAAMAFRMGDHIRDVETVQKDTITEMKKVYWEGLDKLQHMDENSKEYEDTLRWMRMKLIWTAESMGFEKPEQKRYVWEQMVKSIGTLETTLERNIDKTIKYWFNSDGEPIDGAYAESIGVK